MFSESGKRILDQMERRFSGVALPQIVRWIATFQALSWALSLFSPDFRAWLVFDRASILGGEVWRLVSWVFFPVVPGNFHPITAILFVVIALLFFFFISDSLESAWSSFRVNIYVFSTILLTTIVAMLPLPGIPATMLSSVFYSSVFLAFCTLYPNQVIHLFAIIPIKARWLGIANAALLVGAVLTAPIPWTTGLLVLAGLTPYFAVFVPGFSEGIRQRGESSVRRHKFDAAKSDASAAFHECATCGATELTDPGLEFRVARDGEEYCLRCRPEKTKVDS